MKRLYTITICLILLFSCKSQKTSQKEIKEEKKLVGIVKYENVRLRSEPNINGTVIKKINKGETVSIIKKTEQKEKIQNYDEDFWYQVETANKDTGWIFGQLLEITIYDSTKNISVETINFKTIKKKQILNITSNIEMTSDYLFYTTSDFVLHSISSLNGKEIWKKKINTLNNPKFQIYKKYLYISNEDGMLYAVDIINGDIIWNTKLKAKIDEFIIYNDIIFSVIKSDILLLSAKNAKHLYEYKFKNKIDFINIKNNNLYIFSDKEFFIIKIEIAN